MSSEIAVQALNITHNYGDRIALSNVAFEVNRGEIFGLLGPNGGGKTTLFRILSTSFPATSGDAAIFGDDVRLHPDRVRRRIGVVFQNPSRDKKLTVRENLMHHGHIYGMRGAELNARMKEMMERLGIADRTNA